MRLKELMMRLLKKILWLGEKPTKTWKGETDRKEWRVLWMTTLTMIFQHRRFKIEETTTTCKTKVKRSMREDTWMLKK